MSLTDTYNGLLAEMVLTKHRYHFSFSEKRAYFNNRCRQQDVLPPFEDWPNEYILIFYGLRYLVV